MKLIIDASIEKVTTRRDNTNAITIGTQEINAEQRAVLFGFSNKHCKILISDSNILQQEISEVEKVDLDSPEKKKQSQRIRNALFVWHKQDDEIRKRYPDFDKFYFAYTEEVLSNIKSKINPNP